MNIFHYKQWYSETKLCTKRILYLNVQNKVCNNGISLYGKNVLALKKKTP